MRFSGEQKENTSILFNKNVAFILKRIMCALSFFGAVEHTLIRLYNSNLYLKFCLRFSKSNSFGLWVIVAGNSGASALNGTTLGVKQATYISYSASVARVLFLTSLFRGPVWYYSHILNIFSYIYIEYKQ